MQTPLVKRLAPCECGDPPESAVHGSGEHRHPYLRCHHPHIEREEVLLGTLFTGEELIEESYFCGTCHVEMRPM